ncbi:MAG: hypothetical protein NZ749_11900, partial [bacterium]|nr:hypothetical protein [bacterium]
PAWGAHILAPQPPHENLTVGADGCPPHVQHGGAHIHAPQPDHETPTVGADGCLPSCGKPVREV